MYLQGVSTRKVAAITEGLSRVRIGKDAVSRVAQRLEEELSAWRGRPLELAYPYLYLDAAYFKVNWGGRVVDLALLVAVGVNEEGYREVLVVEPAGGERKEAWRNLLKGLVERGLRGVRLVISDDHPSIRQAVMAELPGASWQRCVVHFMRNVLAHVPQSERGVVAEELQEVFVARRRGTAESLARGFVERYQDRYRRAVEVFAQGLGEALTYLDFPSGHQRHIKSNPSCHLPPGPEKIVAAMLSRTIAAFCIIDDALQAMGHKDDPQTKVPSSVILTLAILAAMELGGKHNKALALAKDLNLFTHVPSPSRFNRRLHALYPLFLPLLHLLSQVWKNLHQAQAYALDTFPLPACENIRAPRSRLFPHKVYRGFVPSKRVYFHGLKLHLLVDDGKFIHEVNLSPGSLHDLSSLLLLPLDLPEGAELYMDRGYESHLYEDLLREAQGVVPMVIRRGNSRRYVPWLQYLAIVGRRVVETVGGMLHAMFPRRIHAVTQEGFVIKVLSFVLAHNLKLLTQEMA
jgi:hypothetical protein